MTEHDLFYYLHIPKTAGTTFTVYLDRQFSTEHICPAQLWHQLLHISAETLRQYRLLRGHFYHYVLAFLPPGTRCLTLLRDPVERSLSHYAHILREPGHYLHPQAHALGSLENFLNDPDTQSMIWNFQVRSLALDLDPVAIASTMDEDSLNRLALERCLEMMMPVGVADEPLLQRAKDRLEAFAFVGVAERLQEALAVLSRMFGWDIPREFPALNVAPKRIGRHTLPGRTLDLLHEYTQLDADLYQHAQRLFDARFRQIDNSRE